MRPSKKIKNINNLLPGVVFVMLVSAQLVISLTGLPGSADAFEQTGVSPLTLPSDDEASKGQQAPDPAELAAPGTITGSTKQEGQNWFSGSKPWSFLPKFNFGLELLYDNETTTEDRLPDEIIQAPDSGLTIRGTVKKSF